MLSTNTILSKLDSHVFHFLENVFFHLDLKLNVVRF